MQPSSRATRRSSARTSRRRDAPTAQKASPVSGASNEPSAALETSLEVTFCVVQRVAGRAFLLLCTRSSWRLYRLDGFSAGRESCSPVQLLFDPQKDAGRLSDVRFFRLYELPAAVASTASSLPLGALFVSERSNFVPLSDDEDEDFVAATAEEEDDSGHEEISVLALDDQRLLHKLPPSPSLVLDVQTNAVTAAVLCETRELFLYDLVTFQLQQTLVTASPAMALGARWLAYPGFAQTTEASQTNGRQQSLSGQGDSDSDFDDVPIEALVNGGVGVEARDASHSSSPSYTAIDVAQNVASGLYYLSEVGRATIAPYLSSSPGKPSNGALHHNAQTSFGHRNSNRSRKSSLNGSTDIQSQKTHHKDDLAASKKHPGWVVVLDLVTKRVVANFPCHSTALVNLSMDFSGLLLATSSTKGQNLHVYRLSPPLQSVVNKPGGSVVGGHGALHHQLLYKLQRGITHASIQDIAFSQDGKWINVTSAHGTSHLYALHPEGARVSADTHANTVESAANTDADGLGPGFPQREVNDFYADFRTLETRTQTQVLRIRHEFKNPVVPIVTPPKPTPVSSKARTKRSSSSSSSSSMSSTSSSSSPPGLTFQSPPTTGSLRSSTIMESALDASQALLSQLATSAMDFGHQHFENEIDVDSRRRRLRQRLCCLFAPDGLKMLISCDSVLKLYSMRVTPLSQHKADHARSTSSDPKTKNSKSSLSSFGFEASVTELKSWELLSSSRRKSESLSSGVEDRGSLSHSSTNGDISCKSELRTFAQRSLPLWAHPKVIFKAIDEDHPEGQVLEVKRKGPNPSQDLSASTMAMAPEGYANGDEQLFVMEMDSYFGIGGSPVFDGRSGGRPATPEVPPPLDLAASINMAMSSSLSETPPKPIPEVKNTICFRSTDQNAPPNTCGLNNGAGSAHKSKKKRGKNRRIITPLSSSEAEVEVLEEGSTTGGLASLQFTMQDMYFALPAEETSG